MQGMDYVYAVWQEKSFSAAARKLFVSQPALSASVRKVERELGLPIFNRSTTPLQLTDAGRAYIDAAYGASSASSGTSRATAMTSPDSRAAPCGSAGRTSSRPASCRR